MEKASSQCRASKKCGKVKESRGKWSASTSCWRPSRHLGEEEAWINHWNEKEEQCKDNDQKKKKSQRPSQLEEWKWWPAAHQAAFSKAGGLHEFDHFSLHKESFVCPLKLWDVVCHWKLTQLFIYSFTRSNIYVITVSLVEKFMLQLDGSFKPGVCKGRSCWFLHGSSADFKMLSLICTILYLGQEAMARHVVVQKQNVKR